MAPDHVFTDPIGPWPVCFSSVEVATILEEGAGEGDLEHLFHCLSCLEVVVKTQQALKSMPSSEEFLRRVLKAVS